MLNLANQLKDLEILSPLVLAVTGAVAWYIQKIVSGGFEFYSRLKRETELARALNAEILTLYSSYEKEFSPEHRKTALNAVGNRYLAGRARSLVISSASRLVVFDAVKDDITQLPEIAITSVVNFYTTNDLFDASYKLQSSDIFPKIELDAQLAILEEVHDLADLSIAAGTVACSDLSSAIRHNELTTFNIRVYSIVVPTLMLLIALVLYLRM